MELMAFFFTSSSIVGLFKFFALFSCRTGEAKERVKDVALAIAEDRASRVAAAANQNEPVQLEVQRAPCAAAADAGPGIHAAALGIEGREPPAVVETPKTTAEAIAAEFIKGDPEYKPRRARKRVEPHPSSVNEWFAQRCFPAPGRILKASEAIADYKALCERQNLEPVGKTTFGMVMKDELKVAKKRSGGSIKYLDVGLRAGKLRLVSSQDRR
jgi:hypothetical protein